MWRVHGPLAVLALGFLTFLVSSFLIPATADAPLNAIDALPDVKDDDPEIVTKIREIEAKRKKFHAREKKLFTSPNAFEAQVTFDHQVEIIKKQKLGVPTRAEALNQIDAQLNHLFGPLGENEDDEDGKTAAVPRGDYHIARDTISIKIKPGQKRRSQRDDNTPVTYVVSYHYEGILMIEREKEGKLEIILPRNPKTVFTKAEEKSEPANACTDDHYDSLGDFWYFWDPRKEGCGLTYNEESPKDNDYDYVTKYTVAERKQPKSSYPNYWDYVDKNDGVIRMAVLMGLDEPLQNAANRNPYKSKDINAVTYRKLRADMLKNGFKAGAPWTRKEIKAIADLTSDRMKFIPYVQTLTKEGTRQVEINGKRQPIKEEVILFFGPSGIGEADNSAFHHFYRDSLAHRPLTIYDGHSGLGGHLDLDSIEQMEGFTFEFLKTPQAIFFNSCSSYTYYNQAYFARKEGGEKFMDILVNGLATAFDSMHSTNLEFIDAIDLWASGRAPRSYQAMGDSMDRGNLFAVVGDEIGNPKTPEEIVPRG